MITTLERMARWADTVNERCGRAVAWLTVAMVLVTFVIVVLRYLFNMGWIAVQESVTYMHALVFMLGAAYTLKHDGHVRVDIFYQRMSLRARALVDLFGTVLLLAPFMIFILWTSWGYVADAWALREGSRETGGLPGVFLLKSVIPLMAGLMLLQGLALVLRSVLVVLGHAEDAPEHDAPREL
jgi:TRAP-type mannitol/chloroaromatic compound transport system permease small subunit